MNTLRFENCLFNKGKKVLEFADEYFGNQDSTCLLVAAAGFDPRSVKIAEELAERMKNRLKAILIREQRPDSGGVLTKKSEEHLNLLVSTLENPEPLDVRIFADDDAPIAGGEVIRFIQNYNIKQYSDIVLDLSALSIGVWYPLACYFLNQIQENPNLRFHFMVYSDPELDDEIISEPSEGTLSVKGFKGELKSEFLKGLETIKFWLPMLTKGNKEILKSLYKNLTGVYKTCPILPFPSENPRSADNLMLDNIDLLKDEWQIDPVDIIYASENNPLNCYRILMNLTNHYKKTVEGYFHPTIILTPMGSKIMTLGAMLAAYKCKLTVKSVETLRYQFDPEIYSDYQTTDNQKLVHLMIV